jgi:hypothetical protein
MFASNLKVFHRSKNFLRIFIGPEREKAFDTLLPLIRYGMIPPRKLYEEVECNKHLQDIQCVKDLVYAAYRARVTRNTFTKRQYSASNWIFAIHPTLGIGAALQISEDGLTLTTSLVSQHAMCLGSIEFEYGNVYYWEVTILQFTSGINIGNTFFGGRKIYGKGWFLWIMLDRI